jgi:hypothetical protein
MQKWRIICLVAGIVVFISSIAGYFIMLKIRKRKEKARITNTCSMFSQDTVFVSLLSYNNTFACAQTICSLFEKADCPLRVYVGVCELYRVDINDTTTTTNRTVVEEYEMQTKFSRSPFCLKDHIRCIRIPVAEFKGVLASHEQIERYLFRGEKYACTMVPGIELAVGWEAHCINLLKSASGLGGVMKRVIISTVPANGGVASVDQPGTYCGLQDDGSLLGYALKRRAGAASFSLLVPALAWSSKFSFCSSSRIKEVPYERLLDKDAEGVDQVMFDMYTTIRLLAEKWQIYHPTGAIAVYRKIYEDDEHLGHGSEKWRRELQQRNRSVANGQVFNLLGIKHSPGGKGNGLQLTARARLGLTISPSESEIVMKLGSMGEYYSILSRIELKRENL